MTDKEKLQKLFDAALKEPLPAAGGPPQRAFPETPTPPAPVSRFANPAPAVSLEAPVPAPAPVTATQPEVVEAPPAVAMLDQAAADALGALLDEKIRKRKRRHRIEALVTAIVLFGSVAGGVGWFVQSPERIDALTSALREIRSVGDVKSLVAKYQAALDRVAARGRQIDQATAAMGVTKTAADDIDPNMDAEMQEMMSGEGKTVGQRNLALQKSFGDKAREHGGTLESSVALEGEATFEY